jgi:LPXTG-motif cell wall-anchored protein
MFKKCSLFVLALAVILAPTSVLALELGAAAKSDINVDLSLESESKLTGSLTAKAEVAENGQYKLLYAAELNNQSLTAVDDVDVHVKMPANVKISTYSVAEVEAEITETEEGLRISLPQIESNGTLTLRLEALVETEQELEEITSPVAIEIATEEVFTAELIISLSSTSEEGSAVEENTEGESPTDQPSEGSTPEENQEKTTTEEDTTEGADNQEEQAEVPAQDKQNNDQMTELPKTGSSMGSWIWVALGLLLIGSGVYLYSKSKVTIA